MGAFLNATTITLVTAGAVFILSLLVVQVIQKALLVYQEKYSIQSSDDVWNALLTLERKDVLLICICAMTLVVVFCQFFLGMFFTLLLGAGGLVSPVLLLRKIKELRLRKFNVQLVESLTGIANAMKAGLTFTQAMEQIAKDAPMPLSQEYGLFIREIKLGVNLDEALQNMTKRVTCEDLDLVVSAIIITRQLGSNMAEMFDTIAGTIRERFRLEGKIKALTAQGKMQGWIVAALPLVLGMVINWKRPDLMDPMFEHWFGYALVSLIIVMELLGVFFIRKIVNIDI